MSQENVELAKSGMESAEAFIELLDDFVVRDNREYSLIDFPDVEVGKPALIKFLRQFWGAFEDYSLTAREMVDAGQSVGVLFDERGRGKGSGVPLGGTWAQVQTFRKRRISRMEAFRSRKGGLDALGLRE